MNRKTVSAVRKFKDADGNTTVVSTRLTGRVVDPGPDLEPMSFDDVRRGADGVIHTADDVFLNPIAGARVWVLDNDAAICAGMRTLLEGWGCRVVTALSEEDLARQVDNYHAEADLLIADYHLDDERNGVDAVAQINARRSAPLPALMITANYSNELKQQIRERGHTLMHKPVRPMKLKTAMSHLLEKGA